MLIADYHLQFSFGYQIRSRAFSSGIENVQKYRNVLGFLKRARVGLQVENHDPLTTIHMIEFVCSLRNTHKHKSLGKIATNSKIIPK